MTRYIGKDGREYMPGLERDPTAHKRFRTHLYDGDFSDPGKPLCLRGYNRQEDGWSIWRGNISEKGICKTCKKRADAGLDGVENTYYERFIKEHPEYANENQQ